MAGVLFVICVPTKNYETASKKTKKSKHHSFNIATEPNKHFITVTEPEKLIDFSDDDTENYSGIAITKSNAELTNLVNKNEDVNIKKCKSYNDIRILSDSVECSQEEYLDKLPLEQILKKILKEQKIKNAVWTKGESGNYLQVIFPLETGNFCEELLKILNDFGIGKKFNSVVSVIPCSLYYKNEDGFENLGSGEEKPVYSKNEHAKNTTWNKFVSSVRARLTVAQVVENVKADAALTFDFVMLLLIATTLSAIALAENNNVYLVSSMLISPMMGPVMAGTFGSVIQDKKLQKIGVLNELIGLGIASGVGFCYGTFSTSFTDKYGDTDWPTYEMVSRGEVRTLWVGTLIALLSGAAVALGILGDNIASLVGVAISASLMPPAVNAGLLWGMAAVYACAGENSTKSIVRTHFYSDDDVMELAALGAMSMCLTLINIICIYIAGILVFKIKEVAPMSSRDQSCTFWKHDIKIARNYNRTIQKDDDELSKQFKNFNQQKRPLLSKNNVSQNYQDFAEHLYQSTELTRDHLVDVEKIQKTWSPSGFVPKRPTIQELKNAYFGLIDGRPKAQKNLSFGFVHPDSPVVIQSHDWNIAGPSGLNYKKEEKQTLLPCIPEHFSSDSSDTGPRQFAPKTKTINKANRKYKFRPKKFVVTPAVIEDLKQTIE